MYNREEDIHVSQEVVNTRGMWGSLLWIFTETAICLSPTLNILIKCIFCACSNELASKTWMWQHLDFRLFIQSKRNDSSTYNEDHNKVFEGFQCAAGSALLTFTVLSAWKYVDSGSLILINHWNFIFVKYIFSNPSITSSVPLERGLPTARTFCLNRLGLSWSYELAARYPQPPSWMIFIYCRKMQFFKPVSTR